MCIRDRVFSTSGAPLRTRKIVFTSLLGTKDKHPLDVPGHGHKSPFAANPVDPTQQELPEAHHGFDDPEHRLRDLLAQSVEVTALRRLQPVSYTHLRAHETVLDLVCR